MPASNGVGSLRTADDVGELEESLTLRSPTSEFPVILESAPMRPERDK